MAAIRSRNTRVELALRGALRGRGLIGYRCHHAGLPGKPDLVFTRWGLAIFIDGGFWHGHPDHFTFGKLGSYWDEKVRRTQRRDREQQQALETAGYTVVRFWDFEVKADVEACAGEIGRLLSEKGKSV